MLLDDRHILAGQRPGAERGLRETGPGSVRPPGQVILAAGSLLMILEVLLWLGGR